jgi:folylpolyglutamate synthase/dihydropteroate synthase
MFERLARAGSTLVATESSNDRAFPAGELARRAESHFPRVEAISEPEGARLRALELAGPAGRVLVTGSLYLLADLYSTDAVSRMRP